MANLGPLPNAPGVAKVRFMMTWNGRPAYNVMHMGYAGASLNSADCVQLAGHMRSAWNTNLAPIVGTAVTLGVIEVTDLSNRTSGVGVNNVSSAGTMAMVQPAPASIALCISFLVQYRFRGGHARMYLPGQDVNKTTGGNTWTGAHITASSNAAKAFITQLKSVLVGTMQCRPVMLSYYSHDADGDLIYRPTGPQPFDIVDAAVRSRIDSQRRRLGKETT